MLFAFKKEKTNKVELASTGYLFFKKGYFDGELGDKHVFFTFFFFVGKALKLCH